MAANRADPDERVTPLGPPRSGPAGARASRIEYVVLTRSDELLEQLGAALDGAGDVRHAENEEEARQCADPRLAAVMLLDSREHIDPGLVVERLHAADGSTVIVVFAPADAATDVARAIKGSAAFAVLPIPVEIEKTRAVLQGAGEEAMARRALLAPAVAPAPPRPPAETLLDELEPVRVAPVVAAPQVALPPDSPRGSETEALPHAGGVVRRPPRLPRLALASLVGLSLVTAAAWLYLRDAADGPAEVVADAVQSPAAPAPTGAGAPARAGADRRPIQLSTEPKEELLDRARAAFHERRYTDPDADNALHYYRSVLARDPQDAEAREGLDRIGAVLDGRLESALAENRLDVAARTLEHLRLVRPDDPALAATEARLAEQRIEAAQRAERLSRAAAERASREAALAQGVDAQQRPVEATAPGFASGRSIALVPSQAVVQAAPRTADLPAPSPVEVPAAQVARVTTPEPVARPAPAAAPAEVAVAAAEFKRIRYVEPTYPSQALERGLAGEVRLRLTVDAKGHVADVQVLSANPAGVFDQAAVNSARKWRFQPIVRDGRPIEASVATTISFRPDEAGRR